MTSRIGTLVYVPTNPTSDDGAFAAGLVVNDYDDYVNVRVFHDSNEVEWRTSVTMSDTAPTEGGDAPGNVAWLPSAGSGGAVSESTPIAAPDSGTTGTDSVTSTPAKGATSTEKGA
jgi:hypothetical protein